PSPASGRWRSIPTRRGARPAGPLVGSQPRPVPSLGPCGGGGCRSMALPLGKLATTYAERTDVIDPERAKAYAAATNDDNPAYESGKYAPPVFGVVPTWGALGLAGGELGRSGASM